MGGLPRQGVTVLVTCWLVGCAAFAPMDEYAAYRQVKLATDWQSRLLAMQHYAADYPQGRWAPEIEAARKAQEVEAFERGKDSREGLQLYLAAFPDGSFAPQAQQRLAAIELIEAQRLAAAERAKVAAQAAREREREAQRTWMRRFLQYWVQSLAGLSNWGAPIAEVAANNAEFSQAFGRAPRPRCTERECVKYYTAQYAIPVPGATRLDRSAQLLLRLRLGEGGTLERAELLMPGWGFSRWYEVEQRRLVVDTEVPARGQAVAWALDQLRPMVAALGDSLAAQPDYQLAEIEKPAVGPTGESTDVTAETPGTPGTRVHARGTTAQATQPPVDFLAAESFRAIARAVSEEEGQVVPAPEGATGGSAGASGGSPDPAASGASAQEQGGRAVIAELPSAATDGTPPVVEAVIVGGMRVVLFAAGSGAPSPLYDGIVIEPAGRTSSNRR